MPTPPFKKSFHEDGYREKLLSAFYLAYGEFIRQFGQTESTLAYHLEEFALSLIGDGQPQKDVLRALLGSRRTPQLADATKLCLSAAMRHGSSHQEQDAAEIVTLFAQVSEIRFLRDRTAHYAIHPEYKRGKRVYFRTLNRYSVNSPEKTVEILFQIEDLEAATADLKTICQRLPRTLKLIQSENTEKLRAWLYKPSKLIRTPYRDP